MSSKYVEITSNICFVSTYHLSYIYARNGKINASTYIVVLLQTRKQVKAHICALKGMVSLNLRYTFFLRVVTII